MSNWIRKFLESKGGNFAVTFGIVLAPVAMAVGAAVDYTVYKRLDNRIQHAADSAVLNAAKALAHAIEQDQADDTINYSDSELNEILLSNFQPYFETNLGPDAQNISASDYSVVYDPVNETANVTVNAKYETTIWQAFGKSYMPITVTNEVDLKREVENYVIDIVMCIDATGSMQNTLDAVKARAQSFNNDLRNELDVSAESRELKVRVKPIFYRDWDDQRNRDHLDSDYNATYQPGTSSTREWRWVSGQWRQRNNGNHRRVLYYYYYGSSWYPGIDSSNHYSNYMWSPSYYGYYSRYYYFSNQSKFEDFRDYVAPGGLIEYPDFIDLDPDHDDGVTQAGQTNLFETFLGSQVATGGWDWPEGAGACLNEAIRSNWYDNQSQDARDYFNVPSGDVVIAHGDPVPVDSYTKVTPIPVVVFWTDAPINSLSLSRDYLSASTPTTYSAFESLWNNSTVIDQNRKMLIYFGPNPAWEQGWNSVMTWQNFFHGGTLNTGNTSAAQIIGERIKAIVPQILRLSS